MRPPHPRDPASTPQLVSVVIAAYDAAETLADNIDSILGQTYPNLELIVVDDGSRDQTPNIVETYRDDERFTGLRLQNGGPSRARNRGVLEAGGELIAFFDADCQVHPECIARLVAALEGDDVAAVGGVQDSPPDDSAFGKAVHLYLQSVGFVTDYMQSTENDIAPTEHNPSCCVLYRRRAFLDVGGFDEGLWPGEDVDLDRRLTLAGWRHLITPGAVIYHYRPASMPAFRRMMHSYGRVQKLLVRRHGAFRTLHAVPRLFVLALVGWLATLLLLPPIGAAATLAGGLVGGLLLELRRRRSGQTTLFYSLFATNLTGWLGGYFSEMFRPRFKTAPTLLVRR